jgi:hypothetical protein
VSDRLRINRVAGVNRVAMAAAALNPHVILSVADNGSGQPRYTTEAPHGLTAPTNVAITGTTLYDGAGGERGRGADPDDVRLLRLRVLSPVHRPGHLELTAWPPTSRST